MDVKTNRIVLEKGKSSICVHSHPSKQVYGSEGQRFIEPSSSRSSLCVARENVGNWKSRPLILADSSASPSYPKLKKYSWPSSGSALGRTSAGVGLRRRKSWAGWRQAML